MTERAPTIAAQSRRISFLANRVELLFAPGTTRVERALSDGLHPLDVLLVGGAGEADRLCAVGVQMIRNDTVPSGPIRELLGSLTEDALLAVYHALPAESQRYCRRDPVWAHALSRGPEDVEWHLDELQDLCGSTTEPDRLDALDPDERTEMRAFTDNVLRRALGLPYEMTEHEEACARGGDRAVAAALGAEHS